MIYNPYLEPPKIVFTFKINMAAYIQFNEYNIIEI